MTGAIGYGKALFLVSEEDGSTEKVMNDIKVARAVFSKNPDYAKLLNTPALPLFLQKSTVRADICSSFRRQHMTEV